MRNYLELMKRIRNEGILKDDRTGVGMLELFGPQLDFTLSRGFPLVTTKKVWFRGIVEELMWMLRGETNVRSLEERGVGIWSPWADENGDLGPIYGHQWRRWTGRQPLQNDLVIDQITDVINRIKTNPNDRRMIVSAWNVSDLPYMKLPPCHCLFQFCVQPAQVVQHNATYGVWNRTNLDGAAYLHCHMYLRSADYFLGSPFNIAQYALLTHMVAHVTGLKPGRLIVSYGSCHLYLNHLEAVEEQLSRDPMPLPQLHFSRGVESIDDFKASDIHLVAYNAHPAIKAPIAV